MAPRLHGAQGRRRLALRPTGTLAAAFPALVRRMSAALACAVGSPRSAYLILRALARGAAFSPPRLPEIPLHTDKTR